MDIQVTTPSKLSYRAISEYANKIGMHHGIYDGNGCANLPKLLEAIGGRVHHTEELFAAEASRVNAVGDFEIIIPPLTSARRDRFTIAHEIGHYFLHYLYAEETKPVVFGRGASNQAETEANVFAASLLMPEEPFKALFKSVSTDWWAISEVFEVSPSAAQVRAQALQLIG